LVEMTKLIGCARGERNLRAMSGAYFDCGGE
jgi:hypothetical protein